MGPVSVLYCSKWEATWQLILNLHDLDFWVKLINFKHNNAPLDPFWPNGSVSSPGRISTYCAILMLEILIERKIVFILSRRISARQGWTHIHHNTYGVDWVIICRLINIGIPIMEIWSYNCLISKIGFPILARWHFQSGHWNISIQLQKKHRHRAKVRYWRIISMIE